MRRRRKKACFQDAFRPCCVALDETGVCTWRQYAEYLVHHPYFHVSLKSHELFHSGMFAWMIDKHPIFAEAFFPEYPFNGAKLRVETEWQNRDITIIDEDIESSANHYVIENKFKSFYTIEQLKRYTDELAIRPEDEDYDPVEPKQNRLRSGVVLGLLEEGRTNVLPPNWSYRSYYDLLGGLKKIYDGLKTANKLKGFERKLIDEYLKFLDAILSVISPFKKNLGETVWECGPYLRIRSIDVFLGQMFAHAFSEFVLDEWGDEFSDEQAEVSVSCPYIQGRDPCAMFVVSSRNLVSGLAKVEIQIVVDARKIERRVRIRGSRRSKLRALQTWNDGKELEEKTNYLYLTNIEPDSADFKSIGQCVKDEICKAIGLVPKTLEEMGRKIVCKTKVVTRK